MPSRKQRRRRAKDRRHEYEYVYVDEEGHELGVEEVEPEVARRNGASRKPERQPSDPKRKRSDGRLRAGAREVPPPSWNRVLKRAGLLAPLMFVAIYLLDRGLQPIGVLLVTAQMLVIFLPLSYMMDRMMYRRAQRQAESSRPARRGSS
jgi:hypothetical protein